MSKGKLYEYLELLSSPDSNVRNSAAYKFEYFKGKSLLAIPELQKLLKIKNFIGRAHAALALSFFRERASSAIPLLIRLLKDKDPDVKMHSIHALIKIAPNDKKVMKTLIPFLSDTSNPITVSVIARYLARNSSVYKGIEKVFVNVLKTTTNTNKTAIIYGLQMGTDNPRELLGGIIKEFSNCNR